MSHARVSFRKMSKECRAAMVEFATQVCIDFRPAVQAWLSQRPSGDCQWRVRAWGGDIQCIRGAFQKLIR